MNSMKKAIQAAKRFPAMMLRLFGEVVAGRKVVYLLRVQSAATTTAASILAYTTQNGRTISADAQTTVTKDGTMRTAGTPQVEVTFTALLQKGDPMVDTLTAAMKNGSLMECWEANLESPVSNTTDKFKGIYWQGYLTSLGLTSNAEGNTEVSMTFAANGAGEVGNVTVTAQQQEQASYVYTDTTIQQA